MTELLGTRLSDKMLARFCAFCKRKEMCLRMFFLRSRDSFSVPELDISQGSLFVVHACAFAILKSFLTGVSGEGRACGVLKIIRRIRSWN